MSEETIVVAPTIDEYIAERERSIAHVDGSQCEYRLGRGQPLTKKKCSSCLRLDPLIDLSVSWTQRINAGRLHGRSVEIVEVQGYRSIADAEASWKIYKELESAQLSSLRRYYSSFTCGSGHYMLRDVLIDSPSTNTPFPVMIAQLLEFWQGIPDRIIHGNPTIASLSFLGRLPVPLKHKFPCNYSSRYLLQVDYGAAETTALMHAAAVLAARQKTVGSVVVGDEPIGAIMLDKTRGVLVIRADATFSSFLREYPRHSRLVALVMLLRGLAYFYTREEYKEFNSLIPRGSSSARNLRDAFEEIRGCSISLNLESLLASLCRVMIA